MNQRPNHRRVSVSPRYTITAFNVAVAVMVTPHLFELAQGQQQEQACTLCHDGSVPPFLDATPALLEGLTCESFESIRVRESDADSAECATFQSLGLLCGCPVPPGGCPMCHDGSLPSGEQLDQTIPMENFSYTCRELYFAAGASSQNNQDAPTCNQWLMPGVLCGCPVPPTGCKLCADGRSPPNLAFRPEGALCSIGFILSLTIGRGEVFLRSVDSECSLFCTCPCVPADYFSFCVVIGIVINVS